MKTKILIFIIAILFISSSWAQDAPPEMFKFQAYICRPNGNPVQNKVIGLQISITQNNEDGYLAYQETFRPRTNWSGMVTILIGTGNATSGVFSEIDWANGPYFISVAADRRGGTDYRFMGSSQLLSVPYALYAKHAQTVVGDFDTDPTNEIQTLSMEDNILSLSDGGEVTLTSLENFSYYFSDRDSDTFGDRWSAVYSTSSPAGFVDNDNDCDDNDANVYPGAIEICDGKDNNCDGAIDEGVATTYYADNDGDGYGNTEITIEACTAPDGYVSNNTDCDDTDLLVYPGVLEICDGIDNNCDGEIDEGCNVDEDDDGYTIGDGDCDDSNPNINPGAEEICDGIDNDCDQDIDEDVDINTDPDNCGACGATCPPGTSCVGGICVPNTNTDNDEDGFTIAQGDCDDGDNTVYPDAEEICDGLDNDCDGLVDEDCPTEQFGILTYEEITLTIETLGSVFFSQHDVQLECNESFQQSYLSDGALQIYLEGNDGGSSLLSKALSMDVLTRYVGANLLYTQNEIAYSVQGKTLDFIASLYGVPVGVDVIRAVSFPADIPLGIDQARDLLENELIDLSQALSNVEVNQQPSNSLLVVFVPMIEYRESLEEAISQIDAEVLGQTTVLFINTSGATDDVIYDGSQAGDQDGDGFTVGQGDCNDSNPNVYPGAEEICGDGIDNDCDGTVDEGIWVEICGDGIDNDCDGEVDEGCETDTDGDSVPDYIDTDDDNDGVLDGSDTNRLDPLICEDADNDGCDDCNVGTDGFGPLPDNDPLNDGLDADGDGFCSLSDCDDTDSTVNPDAEEIPYNGKDDDCDPLTLEDDFDQDGFNNDVDCDDVNANVNPDTEEICGDEIDNNCNGEVDENCGPEIGDFTQGGIVFYIAPTPTDLDGDSDLDTGLVCAIEDQGQIRWYNGSYILIGAIGIAIGTGAANTDAIIATQGPIETNYAAGLARAYQSSGFNDWFLPSKDELNAMYSNRAAINARATANGGANFSTGQYWSSKEYHTNEAWSQHLINGVQGIYTKYNMFNVRAVRAF